MSDSCNPIDGSLPGFSIHGILQARILEWVAISFSRGSSQARNQTQVSCISGRFFSSWTSREAPLIGYYVVVDWTELNWDCIVSHCRERPWFNEPVSHHENLAYVSILWWTSVCIYSCMFSCWRIFLVWKLSHEEYRFKKKDFAAEVFALYGTILNKGKQEWVSSKVDVAK